ncbi:MAG: RNA methyltransferase [Myxococcota bacterium]
MSTSPDPRAAAFQPGRMTELLGGYLSEGRLERMRGVLARRTRHLTALLEHFHDPHNIAACARSADAVGLQDLHIVPEHGRMPDLGRATSMRAERWLTLASHPTPGDAVTALRAAGYRLAVTALDGPTPPVPVAEVPLDRPLVVAFGNERSGVSEALAAAADLRVVLPMRGFVQSLNVSVAFALLMSQLRERLEGELEPALWTLPDDVRVALLDRWVEGDVAHAKAILAELVARGVVG